MIRWQNLAKNRCPKCEGQIAGDEMVSTMIRCTRCPFRITETKMQHIIAVFTKRRSSSVEGPRGDGWERFPEGAGERDREERSAGDNWPRGFDE